MCFRRSGLSKSVNTIHSPILIARLTAVIREHSRITSPEVESACGGTTQENCGASLASMEVEPFFCLNARGISKIAPQIKEEVEKHTFGCQCSSLSPCGSSVTTAAAMVVAMGKLRESTIATVPPPPGARGTDFLDRW